jgi:hypothetical protein
VNSNHGLYFAIQMVMHTIPLNKTSDLYKAFEEAILRFSELAGVTIHLVQREIPSSSMRAQPILNTSFLTTKNREYKVEVALVSKIDLQTLMEDLPYEVLIGWFAHELGHICDYKNRSALSMVAYGVGYVMSGAYKIKAEQRADKLAIANGFGKEIINTKRYMLNHANLSGRYRKQLEKYYYSPEDIENIVKNNL